MSTVKIVYTGQLGTECTHIASGTKIKTDAPVDNNGKGESFSPTDLVATAYGSCMLTIIGIYCDNHGLNFKHADVEVEKIMGSGPRRITALKLILDLKGNGWDEKQQQGVKQAALACPVAKSVDPAMNVECEFIFE